MSDQPGTSEANATNGTMNGNAFGADPLGSGSGFDFSAPDPLPKEERASVSLATEAWVHSKSQQLTVFSITATLVVLLYLAATLFAGTALYMALSKYSVDWHTWLIALAFLLPPTILTVALVRAVYPKPSDKNEEGLQSIPAVKAATELLKSIKE
ncbi:hypothetical protein [Alcaligenes faecalis]|uniref:hypothetical protein n=1 Tax=Alcaligenes faecalis TaxID=511 RepID=UPI00214FC825|nr:hypothetical protein [Alcaligenes faecalis]MCR4143497.1 hypothetical protein [Alcaligenes faecalis]